MNKDLKFNQYSWSKEHLNNIILEGKHKIISNSYLAKAFKNIDRADFVPEDQKNSAYSDQEIEIGFGQKLDKPTLIAEQLDLLDPFPEGRYLDIGAGSGYTAALLAKVTQDEGKVIALERILYLVHQMRENFKKYPELSDTIEIMFKDGSEGFLQEAPFDGIVSAVSFEQIPQTLVKQLKIDGKIVIPTNNLELKIITRVSKEEVREQILHGYIFDNIQKGVE